MRTRWLSLIAVLLGSAVVLGQQPAQPQAVADAVKLDEVLGQWEQVMSGISTLHCKVTRTALNKVYNSTDVFEGEAKYVKPNKASVWLQNTKKPQEFERLVCNGQTVYKWEPKTKKIEVHQLPAPPPGQVNDDNFVSFLCGMRASAAKKRYQLTLSEDQHYHYLDVLPREDGDKAEFARARLVLTKRDKLPRQLWFEQPNGNETTWDFPKMQTNGQIDPREFDQPQPPAGWELLRAPNQKKL